MGNKSVIHLLSNMFFFYYWNVRAYYLSAFLVFCHSICRAPYRWPPRPSRDRGTWRLHLSHRSQQPYLPQYAPRTCLNVPAIIVVCDGAWLYWSHCTRLAQWATERSWSAVPSDTSLCNVRSLCTAWCLPCPHYC